MAVDVTHNPEEWHKFWYESEDSESYSPSNCSTSVRTTQTQMKTNNTLSTLRFYFECMVEGLSSLRWLHTSYTHKLHHRLMNISDINQTLTEYRIRREKVQQELDNIDEMMKFWVNKRETLREEIEGRPDIFSQMFGETVSVPSIYTDTPMAEEYYGGWYNRVMSRTL